MATNDLKEHGIWNKVQHFPLLDFAEQWTPWIDVTSFPYDRKIAIGCKIPKAIFPATVLIMLDSQITGIISCDCMLNGGHLYWSCWDFKNVENSSKPSTIQNYSLPMGLLSNGQLIMVAFQRTGNGRSCIIQKHFATVLSWTMVTFICSCQNSKL